MSLLDLLGLNRIFKAGVEVKPTRKILNFIGDGVTITDDEAHNRTNITIAGGGGGSGDGTVTGPETSTAGHVATYAGADGTELADGGVALADLATEQYVDDAIAAIPGGGGDTDGVENLSDVAGATLTDALNELLAGQAESVVLYRGGLPTPGNMTMVSVTWSGVLAAVSSGAWSDVSQQGVTRVGDDFTVAESGLYLVSLFLPSYTGSTVPLRGLRVLKNGSATVLSQVDYGGSNAGTSSDADLIGTVELTAGDVIRFEYYNQTGVTLFTPGTVGGVALMQARIDIVKLGGARGPKGDQGAGGWHRITDENFTQRAPASLGNGPIVIAGRTWTLSNIASGADSVAINASGLQIDNNGTSTQRYAGNAGADTAPCLRIKLSDLYPDFVLGQTELRFWVEGGSNGNSNHEVFRIAIDGDPWAGNDTDSFNWQVGYYDTGVRVGCLHTIGDSNTGGAPYRRADVNVSTFYTPANVVVGFHMRDPWSVDYLAAVPNSVPNTDPSDNVAQFKNLSIEAIVRQATSTTAAGGSQPNGTAFGYAGLYQSTMTTTRRVQTASGPRALKASDVCISIASATNNTANHLISTLKRLVIEVKD